MKHLRGLRKVGRIFQSQERRERRYAPYHIEALVYEGNEYTIIQRLYEDNIDGKISDERFSRMSATYEAEQKQLEIRLSELQHFIDSAKEQRLDVDSFLGLVRKYTDITELTAEIIRTFVERIEVFQPEKIRGTRTKKTDDCNHLELYRGS